MVQYLNIIAKINELKKFTEIFILQDRAFFNFRSQKLKVLRSNQSIRNLISKIWFRITILQNKFLLNLLNLLAVMPTYHINIIYVSLSRSCKTDNFEQKFRKKCKIIENILFFTSILVALIIHFVYLYII